MIKKEILLNYVESKIILENDLLKCQEEIIISYTIEESWLKIKNHGISSFSVYY